MRQIFLAAISGLLFIILLTSGVAVIASLTTSAVAGNEVAGPAGDEKAYAASGGVQVSGTVTDADIVRVQGIDVHKSIAANVDALLTAARADGVALAGWGWRSNKRQIELRIQNCGGNNDYAKYQKPSTSCSPPTARPGRSQHEIGLAIDFTYGGSTIKSRNSAAFRWLNANAARYGLKNLPSEPWHWSTTGR